MLRAHWAALALGAGIGLACGCSSLCNHPLLSGLGVCTSSCEGCAVESPISEGPVLEDYNPPVLTAPPAVPPLGLQPTVPPLTAPPRLAPQPQSQPLPYQP